MEYQIEEISPIKRKVSVQVPADEVNASLGATIALYRKSADVKGFRKGKVPSSIIEGRYKKQIYDEATTDLVNLHINEIMGELKLTPVSGIDYDGETLVKDEEFSYAINFEVMPDFDIPPYADIEIEQEVPEVQDDEVQAVFDRIRDQLAELVKVEDKRKPVDSDIVIVSFQAMKDGKAVEDLSADNFQLCLGKGEALPAFEEIIKTLEPGEETQQTVDFPEEFLNPDMAGQSMDMLVRLKEIQEKVLPELDDALAKKAGGFDNVEKMREAVINSYMDSRKQLARAKAQKQMLDKLMKMVDYPLPEGMVEKHLNRMVAEAKDRIERQGRSLESTGKTVEDLAKDFREEAEDYARAEIMLLSVASKESMEVSEQEIEFFFQQTAARTGQDLTQLKKYYMENNMLFAVRDRLLADKAMELMYSKAKITEVPAKPEGEQAEEGKTEETPEA